MIYRIDKADLEPRLAEHPELIGPLAGLAKFRAKARAALLEAKPVVADTGRFVSWLRKNVRRFEVPLGRWQKSREEKLISRIGPSPAAEFTLPG